METSIHHWVNKTLKIDCRYQSDRNPTKKKNAIQEDGLPKNFEVTPMITGKISLH
jgi:hypothetical protein